MRLKNGLRIGSRINDRHAVVSRRNFSPGHRRLRRTFSHNSLLFRSPLSQANTIFVPRRTVTVPFIIANCHGFPYPFRLT